MALLDRSEWYDLARTSNWTPTYVTMEELFPPDVSDAYGIPIEEWEKFDEPFKVSYREYVKIQREKDVGAYSVVRLQKMGQMFGLAKGVFCSSFSYHAARR